MAGARHAPGGCPAASARCRTTVGDEAEGQAALGFVGEGAQTGVRRFEGHRADGINERIAVVAQYLPAYAPTSQATNVPAPRRKPKLRTYEEG